MDIYPVVCYKVDESGNAQRCLVPDISEDTNIDENVESLDASDHCSNEMENKSEDVFAAAEVDLVEEEVIQDCSDDIQIDEVGSEILNNPTTKQQPHDAPQCSNLQCSSSSSHGQSVPSILCCERAYPVHEVAMMVKDIAVRVGCLYRALSLAMFGDQMRYTFVRNHIISNISNNWEHYKNIVQSAKVYNVEIKDSNHYKSYMSIDGRQGGDLELCVATRIFNIVVDLINSRDKTIKRFGKNLWAKKFILIYFTPCYENGKCTYDIILDKNVLNCVNYAQMKMLCVSGDVRLKKELKRNIMSVIHMKTKSVSTNTSSTYTPTSDNSILLRALMSEPSSKLVVHNVRTTDNKLSCQTPPLVNFANNDIDSRKVIAHRNNCDVVRKKQLLKKGLLSPNTKRLLQMKISKGVNSVRLSPANPSQRQYFYRIQNVEKSNKTDGQLAVLIKANQGKTPFHKLNQTNSLNDRKSISTSSLRFLPT